MAVGAVSPPLLLLPPGPRHAACAVAKVLPCRVPVLVLFAMRGPSGIRPLKPLYFTCVLVLFKKWLFFLMISLVVGCICVFWQIVWEIYIIPHTGYRSLRLFVIYNYTKASPHTHGPACIHKNRFLYAQAPKTAHIPVFAAL